MNSNIPQKLLQDSEDPALTVGTLVFSTGILQAITRAGGIKLQFVEILRFHGREAYQHGSLIQQHLVACVNFKKFLAHRPTEMWC